MAATPFIIRGAATRIAGCAVGLLLCSSWTATAAPIGDSRIEPTVLRGDRIGASTSLANKPDSVTDEPSIYRGVASLFIGGRRLATGTAISPRHILTAAHVFDVDNDGVNDAGHDVAVIFNLGGGRLIVIPPPGIAAVDLHPDFTGFRHPSVNDDLAIITLIKPLPPDVPIARLASEPVEAGQTIRFVGYGETGDGARGYDVGSGFFTTRREGANAADLFFADDEGSGAAEVWQYDFDAPQGVGFAGGPSLGPGVESTLGEGDSGGPGFITMSGELRLVSVNTFITGPATPGTFGSGGGGQLLSAYMDWINSFINPHRPADLNQDAVVDSADLRLLLASWGASDAALDLSGNGVVDQADLLQLLNDWGR